MTQKTHSSMWRVAVGKVLSSLGLFFIIQSGVQLMYFKYPSRLALAVMLVIIGLAAGWHLICMRTQKQEDQYFTYQGLGYVWVIAGAYTAALFCMWIDTLYMQIGAPIATVCFLIAAYYVMKRNEKNSEAQKQALLLGAGVLVTKFGVLIGLQYIDIASWV